MIQYGLVWSCLLGIATAQCGIPFVPPQKPIAAQWEDEVLDAVLLVTCCAQCTQNDDIQDAADALLQKLNDGQILQQEGDGSWRAYTQPDTQCLNHVFWSTDPHNSIVVNTGVFFDYADRAATCAILGAALAHEYLHCLTFVNSKPLGGGDYDDACGLYENEVLCASAEVLVLNCMMACGCLTGLTGGGQGNIDGRLGDMGKFIDFYSDLLGICQ